MKIRGKENDYLRYADNTTLMAEIKEELKSLFMKVKEESEKAGLKLKIQKTRIMGSSPITSWQIDGETMETVMGFIFLGSKMVTAVILEPRKRNNKRDHLCSTGGLSPTPAGGGAEPSMGPRSPQGALSMRCPDIKPCLHHTCEMWETASEPLQTASRDPWEGGPCNSRSS